MLNLNKEVSNAQAIKLYEEVYKLSPALKSESSYSSYLSLLYEEKKDTVKSKLIAYAKRMALAENDEQKWMDAIKIYSLLKMDDEMDTNASATLSCSALTAYGAVKNTNLKPNDNVVIVGAGGLGLMAMQLAKAVTGARIIAMDLDDEKLGAAKKNGADNIINSKKEVPVKAVMELTDKMGADAVIDFVNASKTVESDMQFLRRRARLVLVGLFGGELKLSLVSMPTRAYRLIGSYTGTLNDMIELVSLAKRGIIKPLVSNRFKLNQATEALTMLKEGKILGRGVINT